MLNKSKILRTAVVAALVGFASAAALSPAEARGGFDRGGQAHDNNGNQGWGGNRDYRGVSPQQISRLLDWTHQLQDETRSNIRAGLLTPGMADSASRNLNIREAAFRRAIQEGGMSQASYVESQDVLNKIQTNMRADAESNRGNRGDRGDRGGRWHH